MRKRKTPGPVRIGAVEIARTGVGRVVETDTVGTAKTDTVDMVETGVENMAETGVTGAAGEVAVGISVFVATLGSSKVSAIRGMDMQNKGRLHQRVT